MVVAVTTWPVVWDKGRDSFPLSSYPMFARPEVKPTVHLHYAIAVDGNGERIIVGPEHVANSEVLQARAALSRAVRSRKRANELCEKIVASIADDGDFERATEVRIVSGKHDAVAYLRGDTEGQERVRATCPTGAQP